MKKTIYKVYIDGVRAGFFYSKEDAYNYVNEKVQNVPYFQSAVRVTYERYSVVSINLDRNEL